MANTYEQRVEAVRRAISHELRVIPTIEAMADRLARAAVDALDAMPENRPGFYQPTGGYVHG